MSHELDETVAGETMMAYAGDLPWHGLGFRIPDDATPEETMKAARLDWTVDKASQYIKVGDQMIETSQRALVRSSDNKVLDYVGPDWNVVQNAEAFEFFNDFCDAGEMTMHTAGALHGGQVVWALAKVGESFDLFDGDVTESYLLFTNPHRFGQSIDIRFTPIRVVCNNTITMALGRKSNRMFRQTHRIEFDADKAKLAIGIAADQMAKYKEAALILGSKRAEKLDCEAFMQKLFPVHQYKKDHVPTKLISANAARGLELIERQPGAAFAEGSWWQAFNAVTFMADHELGQTQDNRLSSAWFGKGADVKLEALNLAMKMAATSRDLEIA